MISTRMCVSINYFYGAMYQMSLIQSLTRMCAMSFHLHQPSLIVPLKVEIKKAERQKRDYNDATFLPLVVACLRITAKRKDRRKAEEET